MDHVLTQQDFAVFKEAVEYWMGFFGLKDWAYEFRMCQLDSGVGAETRFNRPGRLVTFCLNQIRSVEAAPTAKTVCRSAFHEVCEVLLDDMEWEVLTQCEKACEVLKLIMSPSMLIGMQLSGGWKILFLRLLRSRYGISIRTECNWSCTTQFK